MNTIRFHIKQSDLWMYDRLYFEIKMNHVPRKGDYISCRNLISGLMKKAVVDIEIARDYTDWYYFGSGGKSRDQITDNDLECLAFDDAIIVAEVDHDLEKNIIHIHIGID